MFNVFPNKGPFILFVSKGFRGQPTGLGVIGIRV